MGKALLISVALISTCGLVYELIAGALASYLLGDSVTQFSLIIGTYLFSMGIGSYLSKYFKKGLLERFIQVELLVGLIGGFSAAVLFVAFEHVQSFRLLLFSFVVITGALVGLEIPLLMRILKDEYDFSDLVSKIFSIDYVGALFASLLFPLVLVPYLGLLRTSFLFGGLNVAVGLWTLYLFKDRISQKNNLMIIGSIFFVLIVGGFIGSQRMLHFAEGLKYGAPIVYKKQSKYQRLVITQQNEGFRLFLNGNLQFDSRDEYRYHEALIHPALAALKDPRHVLVLGGGDGLAVREILKYPTIESITLVDLDPAMTKIFSTNPMLVELNEGSLKNPKVKVINDDAFIWLRQNKRVFDFIAIDFPDPSNYSLGKLYSKSFFLELRKALNPNGLFSIQSTSPYFARESYWCVASTIEEAGFKITPYHAYVPSFGEWGYFIGAFGPYLKPKSFPEGLKFLTKTSIEPLFDFPPDMKRIKVPAQKLNNQILVHLFEKEWSRVN
jgi:spermidine synthase